MLALPIVDDDANGEDGNDDEYMYQKDYARAWAMKTTDTFVV